MTRLLIISLLFIGCSPEQECISLDIYSENVLYYENASRFKIIPERFDIEPRPTCIYK